jgi:hypothetical protein
LRFIITATMPIVEKPGMSSAKEPGSGVTVVETVAWNVVRAPLKPPVSAMIAVPE